jgi:hypothetical protein
MGLGAPSFPPRMFSSFTVRFRLLTPAVPPHASTALVQSLLAFRSSIHTAISTLHTSALAGFSPPPLHCPCPLPPPRLRLPHPSRIRCSHPLPRPRPLSTPSPAPLSLRHTPPAQLMPSPAEPCMPARSLVPRPLAPCSLHGRPV